MLAIHNRSFVRNKLFLGAVVVTTGFLLTMGIIRGFALPESNLRSSLSGGEVLTTGSRDSDTSKTRTGDKSSSAKSSLGADSTSMSLPQTNGAAANSPSGSSQTSQASSGSQASEPASSNPDSESGSSSTTPEKKETCFIDAFGVRLCLP